MPFSRTMHSLAADRFHRSLWGILLVTALLGAWATWFFLAQVTLYEVSATARLEVSEAAHLVEAQVAGRVQATYLLLGQEVQAGDVLVELEVDAQRLQLEEERARLAALIPQFSELRAESTAEEAAQHEEQQAGQVARDQASGFLPPAALGRIQPGQPAQLRLEGFPWTQYGAVSATVTNVASEVRDGQVRVELAVRPDAAPLIPLQHGLPGTVEVEVDRVSPATLVLRTAGLLLTVPGTSRDFQGGRGVDT